jgi:hypothetical protein
MPGERSWSDEFAGSVVETTRGVGVCVVCQDASLLGSE